MKRFKMSRRDFLKLSALKLGTVLGSGLTLKEAEAELMRLALERAGGNKT